MAIQHSDTVRVLSRMISTISPVDTPGQSDDTTQRRASCRGGEQEEVDIVNMGIEREREMEGERGRE